ncbi:beta-1,3-N-acetylglucosaminyltransferase manic fringe-like [Clinocottus analis]|uniref:beta-1,3-N-acetylglucosaminyltransferase manic fringe-like n=1 Tax=Clinocottus analis TaxID=304258 RepID=UPI0035C1D3D4
MQQRSIRRKWTVLLCTFSLSISISIILYVDFQLRTSSLPKLSAAARHRSIQRADAGARDPRPRSGATGSRAPAARAAQPALTLEDVYLAVKTTGRFHPTRLALLLETWISRTKAHTFIFTDAEDSELQSLGFNLLVTSCQPDHSQQALSCKMAAEYAGFMASDKR